MKFVIISRLLKVFIWWQQSDTKKKKVFYTYKTGSISLRSIIITLGD